MKKSELYNFIDKYSGVALLVDEHSVVIYHNNNIFNYQWYDDPIVGCNISNLFLNNSKNIGPLAYAQALNCLEKDRICWLTQEAIFNTEYYENVLYTTIRIIVKVESKEYLLLLIDEASE
ncbi:hypothetical protein [Photobacterium damselae]|uniref:PAS domain-containing protein n=1 Tax=Photobacterium damselae TaxID=38293 RepID=A0ABD6X7S3_PHODM|nr:hypothetical protein [Photobacterium damselae]OBU43864.1 hypothetical protein AYY27_04535 [Photobacterium damselae]PSU18755.1 hypothetical protein CTM90_01890 [Photobacterium damselae]UKA12078.1 hypothetical protein IHC91_20140 [Photobacterium damselae subsp. damselae]